LTIAGQELNAREELSHLKFRLSAGENSIKLVATFKPAASSSFLLPRKISFH
jgi:hypothetical protein